MLFSFSQGDSVDYDFLVEQLNEGAAARSLKRWLVALER